jgi:hypothetical protein
MKGRYWENIPPIPEGMTGSEVIRDDLKEVYENRHTLRGRGIAVSGVRVRGHSSIVLDVDTHNGPVEFVIDVRLSSVGPRKGRGK